MHGLDTMKKLNKAAEKRENSKMKVGTKRVQRENRELRSVVKRLTREVNSKRLG